MEVIIMQKSWKSNVILLLSLSMKYDVSLGMCRRHSVLEAAALRLVETFLPGQYGWCP